MIKTQHKKLLALLQDRLLAKHGDPAWQSCWFSSVGSGLSRDELEELARAGLLDSCQHGHLMVYRMKMEQT